MRQLAVRTYPNINYRLQSQHSLVMEVSAVSKRLLVYLGGTQWELSFLSWCDSVLEDAQNIFLIN